MRTLGILLLGLGITLLVPSGFALASSRSLGEVLGWLACAGLVPLPLIIGGVVIVRRVEDRQAPDELPQTVEEDSTDAGGSVLARVRAFDLNRLNGVGWLLLLVTFGFVIAEASVLVFLAGGGWVDRVTTRLLAVPMIFLAVGFFVGMRWLLERLGVSVYRR